MKNEEVKKRRRELIESINSAKRMVSYYETQLVELQSQCNHELVFKFDDHHAHKVGPMNTYYCPICNKAITTFAKRPFEKSCFKDSRVIDLSDLVFTNFNDAFRVVQSEVSEHYDDYYGNIPDDVLQSKMKKKLQTDPTKKLLQS